ncbi:MAG: 4a-hydroxytetrahydrobiopterin dehydratase [Gaiellaceae bacterium]
MSETHPPTGWSTVDGALERTFTLSNFAEALAFVNEVGAAAEAADHHPDILMHDYKLVTLRWRTHSADAITEKDLNLAARSDELAGTN